MEFVEGGLYWRGNSYGYVECVSKYDDVAVFKSLENGDRMVAFDGDEGYYAPNRTVMNRKIESAQEELDGLKQGVRRLESFIGKLKYGRWANIETPVATDPVNGLKWVSIDGGGWKNTPSTNGVAVNMVVNDKDFQKMNRKALRDMSVLNRDTGKVTEYAEDGTVKAEYGPGDRGWSNRQPKTLGEHETGEELK